MFKLFHADSSFVGGQKSTTYTLKDASNPPLAANYYADSLSPDSNRFRQHPLERISFGKPLASTDGINIGRLAVR